MATQEEQIREARAWAAKEKRKADLPSYSPAYRTQVERQLETRIATIRGERPGVIKTVPRGEGVELSTGEWIDKDVFNKLSAEDQTRLRSLGIGEYNKYIDKQRRQHERDVLAVKDYKSPDDQYNLVEAIKGNVPEEILKRLFGEDSLREPKQFITAEKAVEKYKKVDGYTIEAAVIDARDNKVLRANLVTLWGKDKVKEFEDSAKELETKAVRLSNNDWVSKAYYDKLHEKVQKILYDKGIEEYNKYAKESFPGAVGLVVVKAIWTGNVEKIYGTTTNPDIVVDVGGNRIFVGGRWPAEVTKIPDLSPADKTAVPGRWPEEVATFQPITPLTHVQVGPGVGAEAEWVTKAEYEAISKQSEVGRGILEARGIAAYVKWGQKEAEASVARIERELGEYKTPEGEYNIVDAIREGKIPDPSLVQVFGKVAVQEAKQFVAAEKAVKDYRTEEGEYNLIEAVRDSEKDEKLARYIDFLFGASAVNEAKDFIKDNVRLDTGEWMGKEDFWDMPFKQRDVLMKKGWKGLDEYLAKVGKVLEPFEVEVDESWRRIYEPAGVEPPVKHHNLVAAIRVGEKDNKVWDALTALYAKEDIDRAKGVVTVAGLEKVASEGNILEKSYINEAILRAGLFKKKTPVYSITKNWHDLSPDEKAKVVENYYTAELGFRRIRDKIAIWADMDVPKEMTVAKVASVVDSKTSVIVSPQKQNIRNAIGSAGLVVSDAEWKGLNDYKKLRAKWEGLSDSQKKAVVEEYRTIGQRYELKVDEPVNKALEDMVEWASSEPNEVLKAIKGGGVGITEMVAGLSVGLGGSGVKAFGRLGEATPKAAVGEIANVPIGMTEWLLVQAPSRIADDPFLGVGMFAGALALPFALKGVGRLGKYTYRTGKALSEGAILPRALKTGTPEVYRIEVPRGFDRLATDLERIAKDTVKMKSIFESNLSPAKQKAMVREMLTPESQLLFDQYIKVAETAASFRVPKEMIRAVDFGDATAVPRQAAFELTEYLKAHGKEIIIRGSFTDWIQTKGIKGISRPGDLDISIFRDVSKLSPEGMAKQISKLLNKKPGVRARARGSKVEAFEDGKWHKMADIHYEGVFAEMGYGWRPGKPVTIDGIKFEPLGEQFLRRGEQLVRPGSGSVRGRIGPVKMGVPGFRGTRYWRFKDIDRFHTEAKGIEQTLREQGKTKEANIIRDGLRYIETHPKGKPKPVTAEEWGAMQKDFIDLVDELQMQALERGVDVSITHPRFPEGTLHRIISPASKVVKGVVYSATRDIRPFARAAKQGYTEGGWLIDEAGRRVPAPRAELFASPEAAYTHLSDIFRGEIPEHAGIVAIRTIAADIGKGKSVRPAFRVEWEAVKPGEVRAVVLDELILPQGAKVYVTEPTGMSLRKGSVSKGLTGETIVRHPQTGQRVPVLWFATDAARRAGLGAPNRAQVKSMNLLALKASFVDLLHPHFPRKVMVSTSKGVKGSHLIEFYRDTYKWKKGNVTKTGKTSGLSSEATNARVKGKTEVAKTVAEQDQVLLQEATKALEGKQFKTVEAYKEALNNELGKVTGNRVLEIFKNEKVQKAIKDSGITLEDLRNTYVINLYDIMVSMGAAGLGAATAGTLPEITNADIPSSPTVSLSLSEIEEIISKSRKPTKPTFTERSFPKEDIAITSVLPSVTTIPTSVLTPSTTTRFTTPTSPTTPTVATTPTIPTTPTRPITPTVSVTPSIPSTITPPPPPPPPPPPLPLHRLRLHPKVSSFEELSAEQKLASIAWKQGWCYHLIYPPYGMTNVLHSKKPFPKVRIHKGPKSAYKSLVRLKGPILPEKILWDMGIMDITFTKGKKGEQPIMQFEPDVKQTTTHRRPVGMPKPVVRRRTVPTAGGVR